MTNDQSIVLRALYELEEEELKRNSFDIWNTPLRIAYRLLPSHPRYGDVTWVKERLQELWIGRKVLQVPIEPTPPQELTSVELDELSRHGVNELNLAVEANDCRGSSGSTLEQVAIFSPKAELLFRSRMAEISRLLSLNFQRFQMAPSTGLLRYERRPQTRPMYSVPILQLSDRLQQNIQAGFIQLQYDGSGGRRYSLKADIDRDLLCQAVFSVLTALADLFISKGRLPNLSPFQANSISATLCGLYSLDYRSSYEAHVVTAGVGSGKTFAFQIGALIHITHKALMGERQVQVLLLYPRVVLAVHPANSYLCV